MPVRACQLLAQEKGPTKKPTPAPSTPGEWPLRHKMCTSSPVESVGVAASRKAPSRSHGAATVQRGIESVEPADTHRACDVHVTHPRLDGRDCHTYAHACVCTSCHSLCLGPRMAGTRTRMHTHLSPRRLRAPTVRSPLSLLSLFNITSRHCSTLSNITSSLLSLSNTQPTSTLSAVVAAWKATSNHPLFLVTFPRWRARSRWPVAVTWT